MSKFWEWEGWFVNLFQLVYLHSTIKTVTIGQRSKKKVRKTAKLNMTRLLPVAGCEIGQRTKIKSWIPAKTKKEKINKSKLTCQLNFKKVDTFIIKIFVIILVCRNSNHSDCFHALWMKASLNGLNPLFLSESLQWPTRKGKSLVLRTYAKSHQVNQAH